MDITKLEELFRKITLQLKFNIFEIDNQVDVFIAFETMNNRGKKLSNLELLKNRLIYLSTILIMDEDKDNSNNLRNNINDCWKTIYEYLGKNKSNPLDDDTFLQHHWIMYFGYTREKANAYADFLLNEHFTANKVLTGLTTGVEIQKYVTSMQESIKQWFFLFNPELFPESDNAHRYLLRKLNRLRFGAFAPMAMAALLNCNDKDKLTRLFTEMERYIFVIFRLSQRKSNTGDSHFYRETYNLYYGHSSINTVVIEIKKWTDDYKEISSFKKHIAEKFKFEGNGYYGWTSIKYFLYEYELHLQRQAGNGESKLNWSTFDKNSESIEHIYPNNDSKDCWKKAFEKYDYSQKKYIKNSLGNLLALSISKNSSLKHNCFNEKKVQTNGQRGYFNGSYSEIEVAQSNDWTVEEIYKRGLKMLDFMKKRWSLNLDENELNDLLFLDFINDDILKTDDSKN